ncbi:hypothetical protein MRX96_019846 [Rhipicephalus microplus]
MAGHAGGAPTQRVPMEHISAAAEEDIDMLDVEGPTVGSKRKDQRSAQADDTENTQEPKRPRSKVKKVDVLEQMIDKLVDKTERLFEILHTRLNESDAERNAQHATVNPQLLAMNQRIEDLERKKEQLQPPERVDSPPPVTRILTIVNRSNKVNVTRPGGEEMHGQSSSYNTLA